MRIERMDAIAELVETVSFDELVHHLGELPQARSLHRRWRDRAE
jgi:hypothetical protein